jgi:RNA polymerase sigma-70 factor (ECF subfamily)
MPNLDELYKEFSGAIHNHCIKLVHNKPIEADDLAQDTWIKISKQIDKYDSSRHFLPWAYTIATRAMLDIERKEENRPFYCALLWDRPDTRQERSLGNAEELLSHITKKERRLIRKVYLEGYEMKELAAEEGVKPSVLRKRVQRIRDKLREAENGS